MLFNSQCDLQNESVASRERCAGMSLRRPANPIVSQGKGNAKVSRRWEQPQVQFVTIAGRSVKSDLRQALDEKTVRRQPTKPAHRRGPVAKCSHAETS